MQKLWGPSDVADYLGVPVGTVYQWRTRGTGPTGKRVGKHVRYRPKTSKPGTTHSPRG
ncbi:helix-turn-helix domain-containing protein [Saccharopolyspora gregorii]|uniref:helix-turn-helix domain-containing protein n=1 Tax=Saccharopolyspora gregorii TaxID=33914 RepID=UPI0031EB05FC